MTKLLEEFCEHLSESEAQFMQSWINPCCTCDAETFKRIIKFTDEFLDKNKSAIKAVRIIMQEIKKERKKNGL